jgi:hypothetical protein
MDGAVSPPEPRGIPTEDATAMKERDRDVASVRYDGRNYREVEALCPDVSGEIGSRALVVPTPEGYRRANPGDLVVRAGDGTFRVEERGPETA